ncbi:MAG: hypothetical protein F4147_09460 [Gammaproteobacteria bacterium]|nr:hypothetical protein [Gammaproteobacteria bacterium]
MSYPDLTRSLDPATLSLVGLTPLLAVCTTLIGGLSMGLVFLAVLCLTGVTVSCARRFMTADTNLIYLLLISAAWVSFIDLLMQACCFAIREQLGIYLYLLAMNTTVLFHLEASSLQKRFGENAPSILKTGLTGVGLLTLTGLLRELASRGGILTDIHLLSNFEALASLQPAYLYHGGLHLFDTSAGAFIMFGLLLAVLSYYIPRTGAGTADS